MRFVHNHHQDRTGENKWGQCAVVPARVTRRQLPEVRIKGEGGYNEKILVPRHSCGLGRIGIRYTNIGVMICSWILGEVSELDTLKVGPSEAGDQFQFDKQTDPQTTAPAMHQHSQNLPS